MLCFLILYVVMFSFKQYTFNSRGAEGVPRKGGLNIGQHEGSNMQIIQSKTRANQLLLNDPRSLGPP